MRPTIYVRVRKARDWRGAGAAVEAPSASMELLGQWHRIGRAMLSLAVVVAVVWPVTVPAAERSQAAIREFRAAHPCPLTGQVAGPCRAGGVRMVVDHIVPICLGGADAPQNMQWQEYVESLRKDRIEVGLCRWVRKARSVGK